MKALYTAATGWLPSNNVSKNIAHNLANVSTVGYKIQKNFEDLLYEELTRIFSGPTPPERQPFSWVLGCVWHRCLEILRTET